MLKNLTYFYFIIISVAILFVISNINPAQSQQNLGGTTGEQTVFPLKNPLGEDNLIKIINNVLNYFIYISVPILALMVLWGGFQILSARGNPTKVQSGGQTIKWGVIGFTIILISKGVALILLTLLGG